LSDLKASYGHYTHESVAVWNGLAAKRAIRDDIFVERLLPYFKSGRLLEVGGAIGQWVERLRRHGFDVMGSDIFEPFVQEMQRKGLPARLLDATNLPHDLDGQFDSVFADGLSPQMDKSVPGCAEAVYSSVHRVLKPGGRFICLAGTYVWGKRHMRVRWRSRAEHVATIRATGLFNLLDVIPHQILPAKLYTHGNARLLNLVDFHVAKVRPNRHAYVMERIG
jgi:SAM-dependent methyltransferase